jgi:hypothetical protein
MASQEEVEAAVSSIRSELEDHEKSRDVLPVVHRRTETGPPRGIQQVV